MWWRTWTLMLLALAAHASGLCEVESGQSSIILDIEESRGEQIDQVTSPAELPIVGDPGTQIQLDAVFPQNRQLFALDGKKLRLLQPIDRDTGNVSHVVFQVVCQDKTTQKRKNIPVIVRVSDINDNAPKFLNTPYQATVNELTPIGTSIFQAQAVDADTGVNGMVEYSIVPGGPDVAAMAQETSGRVADGYGYFAIRAPHQGNIFVNQSLNYERTTKYLVTLKATDRARNSSERLSSTTTLIVQIQDDDDQDPSFVYRGCTLMDGACINPEYYASVSSGVLSGVLSVRPERIHAVDMDSLGRPVQYSFVDGTPPKFREYFEIDPRTGAVRQTRPVDTSVAKRFELLVKAEEDSPNKRSATAKLIITVKPIDSNPPVLKASALEGVVAENAPIGTPVLDMDGRIIVLKVHDPDLGPGDPKPTYTFELTTTFFRVESDGRLVVNEEGLDRDPPSPGRFRFQVVAREKGGTAASAPLSLMVTLKDVNDNSPRLPNLPPVTVEAGDASRRIIKVNATDKDEGENAEITYSIYHVSNNGGHKFRIDPALGVIESLGRLTAGEQYSITVQATDKGGRSSQGIVEVTVIPGPNTHRPRFTQTVYEAEVSEGAALNATVLTVTATDPEDDPVTYSIVAGNELRQFSINAQTGVISVIRRLDREDLTRYQLMVRAEDSGGLASTATVNIKVSDLNDKNPEFVDLPYEFKVKEGEAGVTVGNVKAVDADEGQNAVVYYSVPPDVSFSIDAMSGEIRTKVALDYEKQPSHVFVVTATDGGQEPRLATASVTVLVEDVDDELPIFEQTMYEATVPENMPEFMVIQVKAEDLDSHQQITYTLRQGPTDLFVIDPQTGVIRTTRGLDYEMAHEHVLVVGTLENSNTGPGAEARVHIKVEDRNDNAPVFTVLPPSPVTVEAEASIGHPVAKVTAIDGDGTAPNNEVRYSLIGRGKAAKYFSVDSVSGQVSIRDDLTKETDTEYELDVEARDGGEPSLSSSIALFIRVHHEQSATADGGLGFPDDSYTVELDENAAVGDAIKELTIINAQTHPNAPLSCKIESAKELYMFAAKITPNKTCLVTLNTTLDFEVDKALKFRVTLESLSGILNQQKSSTIIKLKVLDVNDNVPYFIFPSLPAPRSLYMGAISREAEVFTPILQVEAKDKDGGTFGEVRYRIPPGQPAAATFALDAVTGLLRTNGSLAALRGPLRFEVEARDDPEAKDGFNTARATVAVDLLEPQHRMVLVLADARPERVKTAEQRLLSAIETHTGLAVGVERVTAHSYLTPNGTLAVDEGATDVWFYAQDPETGALLSRNASRVQRHVLGRNATASLKLAVSAALQATASEVREPLEQPKPKVVAATAPASWDAFPYAMVAIACIVLVLGVVGIAYLCVSWHRYKTYKERMQRMYVVPRYDPVFVEPNLKEYETQVLQMSVPIDDSDSYNDLQLDFDAHKNHAFSLDNVSYITKSTGQHSPTSSEAATTARASELGPNLVYASNNDNVMFRDNKNYQSSFSSYLAETTTEL
ncbi:cadherin-99C isoform X3 [Neocloeon triangulifer]|nr:cadherin-99C isoform X3 [Neocloeon triangulifer]XP_059470525.1 cadherin-99C isoform X3 [Neocloeon triangulifer]